MDVVEAIRARRSTRAFTPQVVEEELLRSLLQAAVQAPSAMNAQPWRFAVVQHAEQLKRYSTLAKRLLLERSAGAPTTSRYAEMLGAEDFNIFYDATTLVAIGVDRATEFTAADCWLAAQNLMLAATEVKLGTCCIGFAVPLLNTADARRELGFSPEGVVYAPVIIGYPAVAPDPVPRAEPRITSWSR